MPVAIIYATLQGVAPELARTFGPARGIKDLRAGLDVQYTARAAATPT